MRHDIDWDFKQEYFLVSVQSLRKLGKGSVEKGIRDKLKSFKKKIRNSAYCNNFIFIDEKSFATCNLKKLQ